eukprot:5734500-Amphidinium_carterae.1
MEQHEQEAVEGEYHDWWPPIRPGSVNITIEEASALISDDYTRAKWAAWSIQAIAWNRAFFFRTDLRPSSALPLRSQDPTGAMSSWGH